jgi:hypothetical protein
MKSKDSVKRYAHFVSMRDNFDELMNTWLETVAQASQLKM